MKFVSDDISMLKRKKTKLAVISDVGKKFRDSLSRSQKRLEDFLIELEIKKKDLLRKLQDQEKLIIEKQSSRKGCFFARNNSIVEND